MEQKLIEKFGYSINEINDNKKIRKDLINKLDYSNFDEVFITLHFLNINVKKINDELIHNYEIMNLLIKQNPDNILMLKYKINKFKELAILAVSKKGLILNEIFNFVKECNIEDQREIIIAAVSNNGWVLKFPLSNTKWLDDIEIVYLGIKHKYLTRHGAGFKGFKHPLENENEKLLNNYDLIKTALEYDDGTIQILNRNMLNKRELLDIALKEDSAHIYCMYPQDSLNKDFINHLIDKKFYGALYRLLDIYKNDISLDLFEHVKLNVPKEELENFTKFF